MLDLLGANLDSEDDPALWQIAVEHILADLEKTSGVVVEIGRCSHWLRPHQTRWTANGGFALPVGYGGHGFSRSGLPLFDWSVAAAWNGAGWDMANAKNKKGQAVKPSLRITIPSRTTEHRQAAIHTVWKSGRKTERRLYGFRNIEGTWRCTAESKKKSTELPEMAESDAVCDSEEHWITCTDPRPMLDFLWEKASDRKLRLFAVACCRRIWPQMSDLRSRAAVETAERLADGIATSEHLCTAQHRARAVPARSVIRGPLDEFIAVRPWLDSAKVASACAASAAGTCAVAEQSPILILFVRCTADDVANTVYAIHDFNIAARQQEHAHLSDLFRDIFGNPFRPVAFDPTWLTPAVVSLAQLIYNERAFDQLPELARALEQAECTNTDILDHCRNGDPHVRGCWVLDLVLGRK